MSATTHPAPGSAGWLAAASTRERWQLVLAAGLSTAATLAAPSLLALSGYLLARAAQAPPIFTLTAAIVGVRLFGLVRAAARYAERLVAHDLALARLGRDRVSVFSRLIPMVPGAIGPRASTDVLDSLVADVDRLQDLPVRVLVPGFALIIASLATVAVAWSLLPIAAAALAVALGAHALALAAIDHRAAANLPQRLTAEREQLARELVVVLDAAPELVAWGTGDAHAKRAAASGRRLDILTRRTAAIASSGAAVSTLASGAAALGVLALTAQATADGRLAPELVPALALMALGISEAVGGLSDVLAARRDVAAASRRVAALLGDASPQPGARTVESPRDGQIAVRAARVQRDGRALLDGVHLDIALHERVALMGPSGAGKSTLAEMLVGFVAPDAGTVRVGGVAVREADGDRLRRLVRWAPQDPHLFPTTLAANLRIAAPDAADEDLERALWAVGGGPWLDRLPHGLKTPLGEQGERCSGGERQRVGLARALLAGGDIVVLDEPASQLPPDEAIKALQAVLDADPSRGALLVTHCSGEASLADRTVHLAQGRI
jgi:thiol reductant ABC exporter CydC subunit